MGGTLPKHVAGRARCVLTVTIVLALASPPFFGGCGLSPSPGDFEPTPTPTPDEDAASAEIAREIEEADIVKYDEGYFYLSNTYTGLRIIDGQPIDRPEMMGGLPLGGRGVELFVRDDHAFVFTAADFAYCAGEPVGFEEEAFEQVVRPSYDGSRLWVVDVTDKMEPTLAATVDLDGFVVATRRVGDVIYATGNILSTVFVTSINIADPSGVFVADSQRFSGDSLDIHVSNDAIYIYGDDPTVAETTLVTYVDISDPDGAIEVRDQFRVPGQVDNRFFIDEFADTLRIVTEEFRTDTFTRIVALYTYDVSNPDDVSRLAEVPLVTGESLRAVRFDGDRGYAVTFEIIDPLFVLDLSDPNDPQVAGELEVPGFSTHLVPLGDRLVGVGFDDTAGVRPAVSLYDVADPADPRQLSRIVLGDRGSFDTSSEATVDEKALRVLEDAGMIMLPFAGFDDENLEWFDALQLISLEPRKLTQRGTIEHRGLVRRSNLLDDRVWILSDLSFQVVDIDDLDAPTSIDTVDIITEQELLDAGLSACADSARYRGTELFFFPIPDGVFIGCGTIPFGGLLFGSLGLLSLRRRRRRG